MPTALTGVRSYLERRAQAWVKSAFGRERAADAQFLAKIHKLKLSILTDVVPGDGADAAESVIVRLLGGSKPNEMAHVRREGGSISEGTYIRVTHWRRLLLLCADGISALDAGARACLGRVLLALRAAEGDDVVLDVGRDFDVQSNRLRIPHTMPKKGYIWSTCRHLPRRLAFGMQAYRSQPGKSLPDITAIAAEVGGLVLEKRLQGSDYAKRSEEQVARMRAKRGEYHSRSGERVSALLSTGTPTAWEEAAP